MELHKAASPGGGKVSEIQHHMGLGARNPGHVACEQQRRITAVVRSGLNQIAYQLPC